MSNKVTIIPRVEDFEQKAELPLSLENPSVEEIFFNQIEKEDNSKILHFSGVKLTKVP